MKEIKNLIKDDINKVEREFYSIFQSDNIILEDIKSFVTGTSKRIRSILCILYLCANNVKINDSIIKMLVAAELIHNASLLQDDFIDDAQQRRGDVAFHKKYSSKVSVLSADYLLSCAIEILLKINNDRILNLFLNATKRMCNAELNQYLNRNKEIGIDDYINIIDGKTASLFEVILVSASILSNINETQAKNIGRLYGTIFQINNDMQNDSIINDKANGIKTAIDILGIEKTQSLKDNYKEEMRKIINSLPKNNYSTSLEDLIELL